MLFCIDSDGCVFDNMRWKHEHAFLPALLETFGLEEWRDAIAPLWFEINLYSRTRGINRFVAFANCLRQLCESGEEGLQAVLPGDPVEFGRFIANPANRTADAIAGQLQVASDISYFKSALKWHEKVNHMVAASPMIHHPFPGARKALQLMHSIGEVHVVSQAPHKTLKAEWEKAGLLPLTRSILGQEFGSKVEQVYAARNGRKEQVLLIGDAPGDERAAASGSCAFYPITPGNEVESWTLLKSLLQSSGSSFLLTNAGSIQQQLDSFHQSLGLVE